MKVAIWGAGKMGEVHGKAYRKMGAGVEIAYIIERDGKKAAEFSEKYRCPAADHISALEGKDVDAVDICLPTCLHREAILDALNICEYIFCEKPVCLTREEYDDLQGVVEKKGSHLMIGQVLRFWSGYVKARELVKSGEIGAPRLITCQRRQKMPGWSKGNWLMDNRQSGGILMDLCIHDIDYLYWMLGQPETVACQIVKKGPTTLHGVLHLSFPGCCANVTGSWGMPEGFHGGELQSGLEIVGDTGMITYGGGNELELIRGSDRTSILLAHKDGYEQELAYFIDCVRMHRDPERANLFSVKGTMRVLWAAQKAAASGQITKFDV